MLYNRNAAIARVETKYLPLPVRNQANMSIRQFGLSRKARCCNTSFTSKLLMKRNVSSRANFTIALRSKNAGVVPETPAISDQSPYEEFANVPYWQRIARWSNVIEQEFLSYRWQVRQYAPSSRPELRLIIKIANTIQGEGSLAAFLETVLPEHIPRLVTLSNTAHPQINTRYDFINSVREGIKLAPMSTRLTAHILSLIDWSNPMDDPIRRQFIPMGWSHKEDHPKLTLDSLNETGDSPVKGLAHRYPDKALFLGMSFKIIMAMIIGHCQ